MTRTSMVTVGILLVAFVFGFAYLTTRNSTGDLVRSQCTDSFSRLDAESDDLQLDYDEFAAYRDGVSTEDFASADRDADQMLSLQEFCSWAGTGTERG